MRIPSPPMRLQGSGPAAWPPRPPRPPQMILERPAVGPYVPPPPPPPPALGEPDKTTPSPTPPGSLPQTEARPASYRSYRTASAPHLRAQHRAQALPQMKRWMQTASHLSPQRQRSLQRTFRALLQHLAP